MIVAAVIEVLHKCENADDYAAFVEFMRSLRTVVENTPYSTTLGWEPRAYEAAEEPPRWRGGKI